jgi:tetratricopeptide (TPR) repeat protein
VDRTQASRQLDARDAGPGYAGGMVVDARYPAGQLLGWTPGHVARALPEGITWRLERGSDLVVQLHLQPTGKPEPVQISVGFYFTDAPPTRVPAILRLGRQTIDIDPGAKAVVTDSYVLPTDVDAIAVQPHAHNLGRRMEAYATLPDGRRQELITIRDWDFRWQDAYRYAKPLRLPRGTTLEMRFTYDNTTANPRNPHHPPQRVRWGPNTSDEMGDLWLQVVPPNPDDLETLNNDFRRKAFAEQLAGSKMLLDGDPTNPLRHDRLALIYLEDGQFRSAIPHFEQSLRLNPDSPVAHYNLGLALAGAGDSSTAIGHFREAIRIDPDYGDAHNNLGVSLHLLGQLQEAEQHYRRAIAQRAAAAEAHNNLGQILVETGRPAEAIRHYREALEVQRDWPAALAGLAWIRATSNESALRNGREAVHLAERAAALTHKRDAAVMDALAAAYAEVGDYNRAVDCIRAAIGLARSRGLPDLAEHMQERLALYEQRVPYRGLP